MKLKEFIKTKKFKVVTLVAVLCLLTIVIGRSFAVLTPVKSVVITSKKSNYETKEPGSWQVTKSAKWTSPGKARITFDLETVMKTANDCTDIILALDISGSMEGDKLSRLKNDASNLIEQLFKNDKNRAAIITFESTSEIVENLTNNKDKLKEDINNLQVAGGTNYYQALKNVDKVLEGYVKEDKRDVILLFLTDGYPTENIPSEVGEYNYLKSQYPYLIINGIQYEMGNTVLEPIKKVSDNQFIADVNNLNNVLVEASTNPEKYDSFTITDYIDERYFNISGTKNINPSIGKATIEMEGDTPKVIWTIEKDTLRSGQDAKLTIDVDLNDEYLNQGGTYPTNRKERITSSIIDTPDEDVESSKTPILADNYIVKYEANTPNGCKVANIPTDEKHSVFQTVNISSTKPTCGNYQFKGWEIVTKDVTRVNNDYFIMPEEDVVIRANWGKLSLNKNMDGEISKVQTLYRVMADASVPDNIKSEFVSSDTGIDFKNNSSKTNGKGVYTLTGTQNDEYPVYYYRGAVTNNNVKFGGFCWKMVRTTSTGGVKLIYNGLPNTEGQCTNTTGTSTQIGTSAFNSVYGSLDGNGYMHNENYSATSQGIPKWYRLVGKDDSVKTMIVSEREYNSNNYYYADSIRWDSESNSYILENTDGSEVTQTIWEGNYSNLKGKYRCSNGTQTTCTSVYYIGDTTSSYIRYLTLSGGQSLADVNKEWNFSKTIKYEDGRYILEEPIVKIQNADWYTKYNNAGAGYYSCPDGNISCEIINYHISTYYTSITSVSMSGGETYDSLYAQAKEVKWIYGNDVEWDGTNYKISETNRVESSPVLWSTDRTNIGKGYHYTCFTTSDTCQNISYVYYSGDSVPYYIILKNGVKIEQALKDMQTNIKDSTIKRKIDTWYISNMIEYTKYLEDTVWCNDRSMSNSNGWTKDGDANNYLYYGPNGRSSKPSIDCPNENDAFTVSEENGNGALIYPVALLTRDEIILAGGVASNNNSYYLYTNNNCWSLSPYDFSDRYASSSGVYSYGYLNGLSVSSTFGVRPAISLCPGIKTDGGDGTAENPFTLELD